MTSHNLLSSKRIPPAERLIFALDVPGPGPGAARELVHTELAQAQPATVILKLFKIALRVIQYQDRIRLQLPSNCPFRVLIQRVTEILFLARPPTPLRA
jgi:hypothetical protein